MNVSDGVFAWFAQPPSYVINGHGQSPRDEVIKEEEGKSGRVTLMGFGIYAISEGAIAKNRSIPFVQERF
jgi:hypothetical protein